MANLSRARKRQLTVVGAAASLTLAIGSMALFTDQDSVGANDFDTGTIVLTTSPTSALVTFADMLPGDSTTQLLTVSNGGTGALRYAMSSAATNADAKALRDQIVMTVRAEDAGGGCGAFTGAVVAGPMALSAVAFGAATPGADSGDRTLAFGSSEGLCVRAALPIATGNAFQDAATTLTLTFDAEQTANNP